jgi:type III secretion protein N (ATPase)
MSVSGLLIRASLPSAEIGEVCELRKPGQGTIAMGEVIAIEGNTAVLSLQNSTRGLSTTTEVVPTGRGPSVLVGDALIGAVLDGSGRIIRKGCVPSIDAPLIHVPLENDPVDPLDRRDIRNIFPTGIGAIDGLLTCAEGQRFGIFGSAGTGKSTLVTDLISHAQADRVVVALVGERGREVAEFIARFMQQGTPTNITLVAATSDKPALERYRAALTATAIAEAFRDQGKTVLLVVDSVTRLARALREVGLAGGEPPVRRGFPPSVFASLPRLFERTGMGSRGSITAFYTVLIEGEAATDPIAEETRSLLDGHIVLSEKLANAGKFPAIDVLESRSRIMNSVVGAEHRAVAGRIVSYLATCRDLELLIRIGEYRKGQNPDADRAITSLPAIERFVHAKARSGRRTDALIQEMRESVQ